VKFPFSREIRDFSVLRLKYSSQHAEHFWPVP